MKINRNYGLVFWIEGFSGSGKSTIAELIKKRIEKKYGKTIVLSGDDLRKIYNFHRYSKKDRIKLSYKTSEFILFLIKNKINVIYTVVGLNHRVREIYKSKLKNFFVTLIKADIMKIKKRGKKNTYTRKKNIVGIDNKAEYPRNPNFIIQNDMKITPYKLASKYYIDISKKIKK